MKLIKRLFRLLIIIMIIVIAITVYSGKQKYEKAIEQKPINEATEEIKEKENFTSIDDISPMFVKAIVCVEDKRFYIHNGFDIIGISRAFYNNIRFRSLTEGGSGITQQLAKNMYFGRDNSITRKVAEIFIAKDIEEKFTKDEILELYLNTIYYGSGYYSIYDASKGYFGKEPSKLTDFEATLLAGVPNAPSIYSPKVNYDLARKRQQKVLDSMVDEGIITEEEKITIYNKNGA